MQQTGRFGCRFMQGVGGEAIVGEAIVGEILDRPRHYLQQQRVARVVGPDAVEEGPRHENAEGRRDAERSRVGRPLSGILIGGETHQPPQFATVADGVGQHKLPIDRKILI